ncbi:MAG: hypothetical protein IJ405_00135 [Lachnospiraceae bacterium]|nr:hypothetical protein [Lachnospiraceae bacterium]MBQ7780421.1 hypothetical protein [Lachnospiraceae bacterium]
MSETITDIIEADILLEIYKNITAEKECIEEKMKTFRTGSEEAVSGYQGSAKETMGTATVLIGSMAKEVKEKTEGYAEIISDHVERMSGTDEMICP